MPDDSIEYYIDYRKQVIAQIFLENTNTEYIVCTYPKVWKEKRYLIHREEKGGKKFEIHCFPQKSYLEIENIDLFDALNEEWVFTIVSKKDKAKTKLTPIYIDAQNDSNEAEDIVNAVWALTNLKRDHEPREQSIEDSKEADLFDVYHAFITQTEPLLRDIKRSYRETTERMKVIRGRLSNRGRLDLVMRPSNRFECIFDEFVVQAPVYKIITTCLDIIMNSNFHSSFLWLNKQYTMMRQRGKVQLRALAGVESYQRGVARSELRRLERRLPRRFRSFKPLLPLMKRILDEDASRLTEVENSAKSVRIVHQATSDKVWERFLEIGFESFNHKVEDQAEYKSAWAVSNNEDDDNKNIDIRLNSGSELIDAKYVSDKKALSKSTIQHQMFFYSFAQIAINKNQLGRLPKRITLIYPVQDSGIEDPFELEETLFEPKNTDIKDLFEELYPRPATTQFPPLRTFAVPLPGPESINALSDTILHDGNWVKEYFERKFPTFGEQFYTD